MVGGGDGAIGEFVSLSDGVWSLPPHDFQLQATEGFGVTHGLWASKVKLQSLLVRDSSCGDSIEELLEDSRVSVVCDDLWIDGFALTPQDAREKPSQMACCWAKMRQSLCCDAGLAAPFWS